MRSLAGSLPRSLPGSHPRSLPRSLPRSHATGQAGPESQQPRGLPAPPRRRHLLPPRRRRTEPCSRETQRSQPATATPAIASIGNLTDTSREVLRQALTGILTPGAARLAALALVVAAALAIVRAHRTRKALTPAQRVRFIVRPSDTFDPGTEEIDRYAAQLARTRRSVRRGTSRTAHAIRIRIDAAGDGTVRYAIEGHRRAASILATPGFHEIELTPVTDQEPDPATGPPPP
jgi:hypothetical protein